MTNKQTLYKKALIRDIQINKHRVFADDEERKEFMLSRFGVDSTTKLSIEQLVSLREFCYGNVSDIPSNTASEKQIYKIGALWSERARDKSPLALLLFAKRICKRSVLDIQSIRKDEAQKLIVAIERLK